MWDRSRSLAMEAIKANSGTIDYNYLVDRYSQSLTKYDIKALFEKLKERTGALLQQPMK
jgi:Zn-dependent M32 family carboxypeptidase